MGRYINEQVARAAKDIGLRIGGIEPCQEMKWTGWEVYSTDFGIIACVVDTSGTVHCGEKIEAGELHLYVDDTENAMALLATEKARSTTNGDIGHNSALAAQGKDGAA